MSKHQNLTQAQNNLLQHLAFTSRMLPGWQNPRTLQSLIKHELIYPVPEERIASEGAGYLLTNRGRKASRKGHWEKYWPANRSRVYVEGFRDIRFTRRGDDIGSFRPLEYSTILAMDGFYIRLRSSPEQSEHLDEIVFKGHTHPIHLRDLAFATQQVAGAFKLEVAREEVLKGFKLQISNLQEENTRLRVEVEDLNW